MIDRNIRSTRSKKETKKAHRQAILTMIVLFIMYQVITRIQNLIMSPFKDTGAQGLGFLLAVGVGIAITGAAVYFVYRYGKNRGNA